MRKEKKKRYVAVFISDISHVAIVLVAVIPPAATGGMRRKKKEHHATTGPVCAELVQTKMAQCVCVCV